MQRRSMLRWSLASAAVLAAAGGAIGLWSRPKLSPQLPAESRAVLAVLALGLLDGMLSTERTQRDAQLHGLLQRIDELAAGLPPHARSELSQLLGLLATAPGRRLLCGLEVPWANATVSQVQAALQDMRRSSLSLRLQAYQALHDIVGSAYFSDPSTWGLLGYPGPQPIGAAEAKS